MKLLNTISVRHGDSARFIRLYEGDLAAIPVEEAVDILVVSAFPNQYNPTRGTLIGALSAKGVYVRQLATSKAMDLRDSFSCWLSEPLDGEFPDLNFNRILCFEPLVRGYPTEVVGDIFQSLIAVTAAVSGVQSVAMPIVATGNQKVALVDMLEPMIDSAVHWLQLGLSVDTIKIVVNSPLHAAEAKGAFALLKKRYESQPVLVKKKPQHDLFISYSHINQAEANFIQSSLISRKPELKLFVDQLSINVAASWQDEIYAALDDCRKVVTLYSPAYFDSKVCREEFNIALFRHRESEEGVLIPLYTYTADLPTYVKVLNFIDCREGNRAKLEAACDQIIQMVDD